MFYSYLWRIYWFSIYKGEVVQFHKSQCNFVRAMGFHRRRKDVLYLQLVPIGRSMVYIIQLLLSLLCVIRCFQVLYAFFYVFKRKNLKKKTAYIFISYVQELIFRQLLFLAVKFYEKLSSCFSGVCVCGYFKSEQASLIVLCEICLLKKL